MVTHDPLIIPMYHPPDPQSGLVLLDESHANAQATRALNEATLPYENRLEWRGWQGPKERVIKSDNHYIFLFTDKTFVGGVELGTKLYLYPGAFALTRGHPDIGTLPGMIMPYLHPEHWRRAIHHPTQTKSALKALKTGKAFLPFWGRATLFPKDHTKDLEALLWAMGQRMSHDLHIDCPFSLTLMGTMAGTTTLEGPTLLMSLPGSNQSQHWRGWMGELLGRWFQITLGSDWRLMCIHQFPKTRQGVLAQANFPTLPGSAHQALEAATFIQTHLPDIQKKFPA